MRLSRSYLMRDYRRVLAVVIGLAAFAAAWAAQSDSVDPNDERLRGLVRPSKSVELTAPTDGIVFSIDVEESDRLKEGQALAHIDDELQKNYVEQARHDIERKTLLKGEAEVRYEKIVGLHKDKAAADWEVRQHKLQLDGAIVDIKIAEEKLRFEQVRLARYEVMAPFDGEVVRINSEKGARVSQGEKMILFIARDPLEAHMFLPAQLIGKVQLGKVYSFLAEEPIRQPLKGKLKTIEPQIDNASGTFRCVFTIENPDLKFPAGFTARLVWPQP